MRHLTRLGALPLKRSAYLLPSTESTVEDFQWLQRQIQEEGGDAWLVEARFLAGLRDEEIRERFSALRRADYQTVHAEVRALLDRIRQGELAAEDPSLDIDRRRLARRLEATRRIDFFQADGREEAEALVDALQRVGAPKRDEHTYALSPEQLRGRTWATRPGVKVDRMASAWLIRRFIDPAARFVFSQSSAAAAEGAIRFDMFEGEFTHDGSRCTFEVLLDVVNRPGDAALAALAQIVHDLDLHDDRYQRAETAGVGALVGGLVAQYDSDEQRIAASTPLFDALYASLGDRPGKEQR